jgi:hypothetical protein
MKWAGMRETLRFFERFEDAPIRADPLRRRLSILEKTIFARYDSSCPPCLRDPFYNRLMP